MTFHENLKFEILQNITPETLEELSSILEKKPKNTSDLIVFAEKIKDSLFYNFFIDSDFSEFWGDDFYE